jgi:hypothetical protein
MLPGGHSILHYDLFISFILFLYCLAMTVFFRQYFSWQASLVMTLIFAYNAWTLDFKTNILSDFPFALFLLAATFLYLRHRTLAGALSTGIVLAFLLLIRGVGLVFLVAALVHGAYRFLAAKEMGERKKIAVRVGCILALSLALQYFVNTVLFRVPTEGFFAFYGKAFAGSRVSETLLFNLEYYREVFKAFFYPEFPWTTVSAVTANAALALLMLGFIYSLVKQRSFLEVLTGLYLLLYLLYPYSAGGFRFLMPVIPFLLIYMARGLIALRITRLVPPRVVTGAAVIGLVIVYEPGLTRILSQQKDIPEVRKRLCEGVLPVSQYPTWIRRT